MRVVNVNDWVASQPSGPMRASTDGYALAGKVGQRGMRGRYRCNAVKPRTRTLAGAVRDEHGNELTITRKRRTATTSRQPIERNAVARLHLDSRYV